ncbi:MAG: DUF1501 domain-containing protein [Planctomycetia bacterium]|nr:DUF1501 domain-containing protein [Planctomycetia bacterium]
MLTCLEKSVQLTCAGISRRQCLKLGALGLGGLTLPDLLRARAAAGQPASRKSVIMICQFGGPSHLDTYDPKPDAPADIRGEFKSIQTRVPELRICDLMPKQVAIADKFTILKKLQMTGQDHYLPSEIMTGYLFNHISGKGVLRPAFGSVVSRTRGSGNLPAYVSLRGGEHEDPQYLGNAHEPFVPKGMGLQNLALSKEVSLERFGVRRELLKTFDTLRRDVEVRGQLEGMDAFTAQAFDLVTSGQARDAFDLAKEPEPVRQKYGKATQYLMARRLAEAGVPVITLDADSGGWDTHTDNFSKLRTMLPRVDHGLSTLITDLFERGLERDVLVVMWGEFGRSPKVSSDAGRDHWPEANYALFSGGGMPMGQVIGATDARGGRPTSRPYGPQNVLATIYRFLGVDPSMTFPDHSGRPVHLLDDREPIQELS